jgi:hypothetical protein
MEYEWSAKRLLIDDEYKKKSKNNTARKIREVTERAAREDGGLQTLLAGRSGAEGPNHGGGQ